EETSQFFAQRQLVLDVATRNQFLDFVYDDLAEALRPKAERDHSEVRYRERLPKFELADTGETPLELFKRWVNERKPRAGSVESWRYVFRKMEEDFKGRSAASITTDEAQDWVSGLVTPKRIAYRVHDTYIAASRRVFGWAKKRKSIPRNPFEDVTVTLPKRTK